MRSQCARHHRTPSHTSDRTLTVVDGLAQLSVDDLQEQAGQGDQLGVWGGVEALEETVSGLVKQDQDGQGVLDLR
ncbi:hypothetical protein DPEC_G00202930 [Dallia pectoralis]|uniref:Uncharacterized protein n=1 Tax=Dallia pectoralis TaxID=75939 RepID=A0ACC2G993_DALPE|nr:hypothetical protein DPEC_G00202930 [Dallia pectoralis]